MAKVRVRNINDFKDMTIDLTEINEKRKVYLSRLSNNKLKESYFAWLMLKEEVSKEYNLDIDELDLKYNEYGKPLFDEFFFNISHSKNLIAVAISNQEIGIDIQHINPKGIEKLSKKMNLDSLNPLEFYEVFSSIEANQKKLGTGIYPSDLTKKMPVSKQIYIEDNSEHYILSIASDDTNISIE